jgi:hypothetical protein
MEGKRERENRDRGLVRKKRKAGGFFGQKAFFLLWLAPRSEAGEGLERRRPAGLLATNADGERGKRRRATRGFFSLTHLGSRRREEMAPRAAADWWWWC